jgi:hypothetical protein
MGDLLPPEYRPAVVPAPAGQTSGRGRLRFVTLIDRTRQRIASASTSLIFGEGVAEEDSMDTTTLLIIVIVLLIVFGGGWYGRRRRVRTNNQSKGWKVLDDLSGSTNLQTP